MSKKTRSLFGALDRQTPFPAIPPRLLFSKTPDSEDCKAVNLLQFNLSYQRHADSH